MLGALAESAARQQIEFQPMSGGHDWAWWNPELLLRLQRFFPGPRARHVA